MDPAWSDLAEVAEAEAMYRFSTEADPASREELGMVAVRTADGVHVMVRRDPMGGYWNKALGFTEQLSEATVDTLIAQAAAQQVPAFAIAAQPRVLPGGWEDLAAAKGLTRGTHFVKLLGTATPRADVTTEGLRITRLGADLAEVFSHLMHLGFEFEETASSTRLFTSPRHFIGDWLAYAAWDGDQPVAAARLLVVGEVGALFGAATLPAARHRGAQSALLDVRIRDAAERGCRYVTADTWAETPEHPNASQRNLRSAGLAEVHFRHNWVWRAPQPQ